MSSHNATFHALLRPCVLQILRATGYYATRTAVLDTMTDLAARYIYLLCQKMAMHAAHNATENDPTIVDLRMALQDVGALLPERPLEEQEYLGEEDMRGVEAFIQWFEGPGHAAIREIAVVDGDAEATDYLNALKKKHSKTGEDSKYHSTILGKGNDMGEVQVEGDDNIPSIHDWMRRMRGPSPPPSGPPDDDPDSRPPSSYLSSVGDRLDDMMDMA